MKSVIHKLFKKFGYKVYNHAKIEKQLKLHFSEELKKLNILEDRHELIYRSRFYFNALLKTFPEMIIQNHKEGVIIEILNFKFYIESPEEFYILKEVFVDKDYNLLSNKSFIIFDIGMNIGISTLYFVAKNNVEKVYSFEPVLETYNQALYNFELNDAFVNKIETYNYGLGGYTRLEKVLFDPQAKGNCGIRLDLSPNINIQNAKEIEIQIKDIAKMIPSLVEKHSNSKIAIKIDCEGAEYEILERLDELSLLKRIDVLLIEWHDKGSIGIEEILLKNNFRIISRNSSFITGMIYAFKV